VRRGDVVEVLEVRPLEVPVAEIVPAPVVVTDPEPTPAGAPA
jgi:hypothetical protein